MAAQAGAVSPFGALLKDWRERRRLSQLDLALSADVSARHVSFLETGRAKPSRAMIERLSEALDAPLPARNDFFEAAGFAPRYASAPLNEAALAPVRAALFRMMHNHAPFPAVLFTRRWDFIDANDAGRALFGAAAANENLMDRLENDDALRASILNWSEVARAMAQRLRADARRAGGDAQLETYAERLLANVAQPANDADHAGARDPFIPVRLKFGETELSFLTAIVEIGSAQDITVADLHLELFFPADESTEQAFAGG